MEPSDGPIRPIRLSGWFAGRTVGSGRYTDRLLEALGRTAPHGVSVELVRPPAATGIARKIAFEQRTFPAAAARAGAIAHVPYWAPPLSPRGPTVVTVHDLIPLLLPEYRRRWAVRAYTRLCALATPRADALIADSAHTAADLARHLAVDPARVHVIPLGVDPAFRPPSEAAGAELRARLGLPERYGLYLGGFDARKDLATLLKAWARVFEATSVPLLVAGRLPRERDPLSPHPADLATAAGLPPAAWRALGAVAEADLPALLGGAAIFAFPSRYEGFGLPPLEAMACGAPVVTAKASSLPEVVGEAGLLVGAGDVAGWAAAMVRVLTDSAMAERMAAAGVARAAGFTWEGAARATWAVCRLAAAPHSPGGR